MLKTKKAYGVRGSIALDLLFQASSAPSKIQIANVSHSYRVKAPGTEGNTFMRIIARPTSTAKPAMTRYLADGAIA